MKRICSFVSIIMLVTLASIQFVQGTHHHDDLHHSSKHSQNSSREDFHVSNGKCFICTFNSNQSSNGAILPLDFELSHYKTPPLVMKADLNCVIKSCHLRQSYNKGPPIPVILSV